MESWQLVLGAFFVLLPVVLMLDLWGDERLDARGHPIDRGWMRQLHHPSQAPPDEHGAVDADASHGDLEEAQTSG